MDAGWLHNKTQKTIKVGSKSYRIFSLPTLAKHGFANIDQLPFSIKILLESALRNYDGFSVTESDIRKIAGWKPKSAKEEEIAFKPGRVILQDFTGVPAVVDLAAMRSAMKKLGGNIKKINPQVPCDLVVDHSIQVDAFGSKNALNKNLQKEFVRNKERYEFLKWGQGAFNNFSVVPPATGIVHQVNLEYLAKGVLTKKVGKILTAYPDSLVGTDSHTTMINGLSIVGWGVGGIEAEAVMLGEPIYMLMPEVVGFKLTGEMENGLTATDLVLTITEILRKKGVVGKFIEYFGPGYKTLSLPDRATLANMAPEYGATMGFCPFDDETLAYYKVTGRTKSQIDLIEKYYKEQGLFYNIKDKDKKYTDVIEFDLQSIKPCLSGPKRPQDRIVLSQMQKQFRQDLVKSVSDKGFGLPKKSIDGLANGKGASKINHGSVVIAAITSCTNTSNPSVLIGAGLLARNAVKKGLKTHPHVKTSFAPGSTVATEYLKKSNLLPSLEKLGFHVVGYGCTTCIGNSGPLPSKVSTEIQKRNLIAAGVLSGNRNFEGRINPHVKANYLASPPLVVAYALAGTVDIDLAHDPIGKTKAGKAVYLKDIWPSNNEILTVMRNSVKAQSFKSKYKNVTRGTPEWNRIKVAKSDLYPWKKTSTYIQEPPFFEGLSKQKKKIQSIINARVLLKLGDSVTTDHISPAGAIAQDSPAAKFLIDRNVNQANFNSYGSRRGNDRIMTRGTFANIRLRNLLAPGTEGGITIHLPTKKVMSVYDAACKYKESKTPLIVLAGKEYGTGSSRDWAAKGTALLGVKVVIAESYERIHRSNLIGMGILPLQFQNGDTAKKLKIDGTEFFDFDLDNNIKPRQKLRVKVKKSSRDTKIRSFQAQLRIDTPVEVDYYRNGGILQTVLLKLAQQK